MKLYKIINNISKFFSLRFFHAGLPVSYYIFNKIFNKKIINKKIENKNLQEFNKNGFVKLNINFKPEVDFIKKNIEFVNPDGKRQSYKINENIREQFKGMLLNKLKPLIGDLQDYYNSNIVVSNVLAWRTNYAEEYEAKNNMLYANHYHNDGYLVTYFKLFINLMDVDENDGPLHIVYKNKTKEFFKHANYRDQRNYNDIENNNLIYKNTGKEGESFLFSSPECMHKAGVPKKHRDIMEVVFIANTDANLKSEDINIFEKNENFVISTTKPYTLIKVFKTLLNHFNYKKNLST